MLKDTPRLVFLLRSACHRIVDTKHWYQLLVGKQQLQLHSRPAKLRRTRAFPDSDYEAILSAHHAVYVCIVDASVFASTQLLSSILLAKLWVTHAGQLSVFNIHTCTQGACQAPLLRDTGTCI